MRSVPWLRIGRIELAGVHSKAELAEWAAKADSEAGMADWFHLLLKEGQLPKAQAMIEADPALLAAVLPIVGNVEASLNVRLGAGVLLEEFAGSDTLRALLPRLGELSQHADARVRADACHYLGLTGDAAARPGWKRGWRTRMPTCARSRRRACRHYERHEIRIQVDAFARHSRAIRRCAR